MDKLLEYVSAEPFDDYAIKEYINANGTEETCDWTEKEAICVSIENLAEFMDRCLCTEYGEPYEMGAGYDKEEIYYENRFPGLSVQCSEELLQELMIETPMELRDFIAPFLSNDYWASKNLYSPSKGEFLYRGWEEFTKLIKHKVRFMFFSKRLKRKKPSYEDYADPYSILDEIGDGIRKNKLLTTFAPGKLEIFRARQHSTDKEIKSISELGSPPEKLAQANRLSPAGIPMFYGALDSKTSIIEILDFGKTTETVSVGKFTNVKSLNLIDFSKLEYISIFDDKRRHLRASGVLLRMFVLDLGSPISNDGRQHIEYVPTQVVTEFLKNSFTLEGEKEIHGIIYPSAKHKDKNCIVLFFTQDHLTEDKKDKTKYLSLDTSKINERCVKDIDVSITLDEYFKF